MRRDYYAFRNSELSKSLNDFEKAYDNLEKAKKEKDKKARKQAKQEMSNAAKQATSIEAHLAYLWYWAQREEAERQKQQEKSRRFSELANAIRDAWKKHLAVVDAHPAPQAHFDFRKLPDTFRFVPKPDSDSVARLPRLSFLLYIPFRLQKPYLSEDERDFYLIDNPLRREKVFQTPMVASTSWKGALRSAMIQKLAADLHSGRKNESDFLEERLRLYRLFGNEKDGVSEFLNRALTLHRVGPPPTEKQQREEWEKRYEQIYKQVAHEFEEKVRAKGYRKENVEGFQGCLYFFPTFFDNIGLEVINPHDRKTGVGARGPILVECVPQETKGELVLLYVPFSPSEQKEDERRAQVAKDLEAVAEGIRAMLTTYGFGAKTSSGYGVAKEELNGKGKLLIHVPSETSPVQKEFSTLSELRQVAQEVTEVFCEGGLS